MTSYFERLGLVLPDCEIEPDESLNIYRIYHPDGVSQFTLGSIVEKPLKILLAGKKLDKNLQAFSAKVNAGVIGGGIMCS